jgi:Protein of unknown function (DUF3237)
MNLTLGRNALMPNGPHGTRVFAPVNSGTLSGPKISGTVLSGADWVTVRADSDRRWGSGVDGLQRNSQQCVSDRHRNA